jgi:hypothetical protein
MLTSYRTRHLLWRLTLLLLLSVWPTAAAANRCLEHFTAADALVRRAGVSDAQADRIAGFPFLRANRFLASFRDRLDQGISRRTWLDHLGRMDREARRYEFMNLSPRDQRILDGQTPVHRLDQCRSSLIEHVLNDERLFSELLRRTRVADEYRTWQRALGLYPVSSLLVLEGIKDLHAAESAGFAKAPENLKPAGARILYRMARASQANGASPWGRIAKDPLGIPEVDADTRERLFRFYAPTWAVDTANSDDRIGTPGWNGRSLVVRVEEPRVYTHVSFTRFEHQILIQLNYTVWFPSRPKTGPFDLLGGVLDGITWRVTLDRDGLPLIFDAMHNCGCYHQFFPTDRLRSRALGHGTREPLWLPKTFANPLPRPLTIYVAHRTHYIENVDAWLLDTPPIDLQATPYSDLRSIAADGAARRSLFAPDGLVPGTERAERWILWPMGVPSPGAMRQWGHHATAFVGRRHFDDPKLFDEYFERAD